MNSKQEQRRELWRQRIAEQEKSGRPVSVFCREHGLSGATFFAWRQRLKIQEPVSFALVEAKGAAETAPPIELILTGGERLRIPCEASMLKMVLTVLRERR